MSHLKLNKASLSLQQKNLQNYKRYLPSLELKRKKLLSERVVIEKFISQLKKESLELRQNIQEKFPMINATSLCLKPFLHINKIEIFTENLVGVRLPALQAIEWQKLDYMYLSTPHWFEPLLNSGKTYLELCINLQIASHRHQRLQQAIQTVTQRKNLFEKVLIPNALKHIRLIQIFLADNERAAVVRSKTAKKKRQLL